MANFDRKSLVSYISLFRAKLPGEGGEQEEKQGKGKSSRHGAKGWKYKVMVGQWEGEGGDWELFGQAPSWDPHTKYFQHPHPVF